MRFDLSSNRPMPCEVMLLNCPFSTIVISSCMPCAMSFRHAVIFQSSPDSRKLVGGNVEVRPPNESIDHA